MRCGDSKSASENSRFLYMKPEKYIIVAEMSVLFVSATKIPSDDEDEEDNNDF